MYNTKPSFAENLKVLARLQATAEKNTQLRRMKSQSFGRGKSYPAGSTRQDARCAKKYYMAIVNGFEIMQTRSGKEIRGEV